MKKLITLTCLLGAFVLSAKSEIKTGFLSPDNTSVSFTIEEGQVGQFIYLKKQYGSRELVHVRVVLDNQILDITPYQNFKVAGPAKLELSLRTYTETKSQYYWPVYSLEIKPNSYGGGDGSGNNVTVLPKEVENMELILESSDDMVKWEKDVIGDKPKANRKKFYRLRAVKK